MFERGDDTLAPRLRFRVLGMEERMSGRKKDFAFFLLHPPALLPTPPVLPKLSTLPLLLFRLLKPRLHPEQERPGEAGAEAGGAAGDGVDLVGEVADGSEKLEPLRQGVAR